MTLRMLRIIITALALLSLLAGCTDAEKRNGNTGLANTGIANEPVQPKPASGDVGDRLPPDEITDPEPESVPEPEEEAELIPDSEAVWMAVGDVMMHMPQLPSSYDEKTKSYNFNPFFTKVKPLLEQGDWTIANLETPIAGKALGYSGFPRFNSPVELASALKYAGFNVITNANNHSLDRGAQGIELTLKHLLDQGFIVKGTARSKAEAEHLTIVEQKGIRMGLLAYTYGTNGIPLPKNQPYAVSLIDEAAIIRDIGLLRKAGTDFITISLHFGVEYQTVPNDDQKTLARKLIAAGADIIAGSHPHVLQPYETVEATNDDGTVRRGLIIYSMGNFISNQRGDTKDCGVIYKVIIHKNNNTKQTRIGEIEPIPTWVYRSGVKGAYKYSIVPLEQTIKERSLKGLSSEEYKRLNSQLVLLKKRLSSMSAQAASTK
ncbi:CapA family protein [Paenibacillus nasutitermitis]|uniref:Capsule biosynthesis protein n=1 Tax=Paenibacillus nasutitermitis TaxID=1652958 RepID=A0A916YX14_9BACL|nr:CapA family protein [Paenibacillus nasutitermitis]GGD64644.1 capsule biosynthesis protein [Paenibacillus nasutitermitis]